MVLAPEVVLAMGLAELVVMELVAGMVLVMVRVTVQVVVQALELVTVLVAVQTLATVQEVQLEVLELVMGLVELPV